MINKEFAEHLKGYTSGLQSGQSVRITLSKEELEQVVFALEKIPFMEFEVLREAAELFLHHQAEAIYEISEMSKHYISALSEINRLMLEVKLKADK